MGVTTQTSRLGMMLLLVLIGCSGTQDPRRRVVPVKGRVLLRGQPVVQAQVTFQATGAPRAAIGQSDAEGRFALSTWGRSDGAPLGDHVVTVSRPKAGAPPVRQVNDAAYASAMSHKQPQAAVDDLPPRYADAKTSDLRCKVTDAGPNEFLLELQDR